jgi:hypothetical protein
MKGLRKGVNIHPEFPLFMAESKNAEEGKGPYQGLVEAIADKYTEFDINLQGVNVKLPRSGISVELNGLVTLTVHMRELSEDEKRASAAKNVKIMSRA